MDNELIRVFRRLRQDSKESVNSGKNLSDFCRYMHVERSVETYLKMCMIDINTLNGGIVLLAGSAGDGKSHMLSSLKAEIDDLGFVIYNDATESNSPQLSAIEILKKALVQFNDVNLINTTQKLLLAINLGKLSAFVDDCEVQQDFSQLVRATRYLVDGPRFSTCRADEDYPRIKIVDLSTQNLFEFYANRIDVEYPIDSLFMKEVLDRVTASVESNPFYNAFKNSSSQKETKLNPVLENYKLLSISAVKDSIVKLVIEAIIRFRLIVTPRDFLDFVYSIVVPDWIDRYVEKSDFYRSLLPSLLFQTNGHKIQQALNLLDPLKSSTRDHDIELAKLFASDGIPVGYFTGLPICLESRLLSTINNRYSNHRTNIQNSVQLVFRLKHLLQYHSDSTSYRAYLNWLCCIFSQNSKWKQILDRIERVMPRHYGSYVDKRLYVPLQNLQGSKYILFSKASLRRGKPEFIYDPSDPSHFSMSVALNWTMGDKPIRLVLDYKLFEYLESLNAGKLSVNYEGEQNLAFSAFIHDVVKNSECKYRIISLCIGDSSRQELELNLEEYGEISLL